MTRLVQNHALLLLLLLLVGSLLIGNLLGSEQYHVGQCIIQGMIRFWVCHVKGILRHLMWREVQVQRREGLHHLDAVRLSFPLSALFAGCAWVSVGGERGVQGWGGPRLGRAHAVQQVIPVIFI